MPEPEFTRGSVRAQDDANPLLEPSGLPFALPPFDRITDRHFAEGFEVGMAEHRAEVDAIIANSDRATFENTMVALERSGQTLRPGLGGLLQPDVDGLHRCAARHRVGVRPDADGAFGRDEAGSRAFSQG